MAYEETEIGTLVKTDPARAAEHLLELLRRAGGNSVHAALLAGVHHSTLKRWLIKLDKFKVRKQLDGIRETSETRNMSEERRVKLLETARENRRVAGLQRMYDRLDEDALGRLCKSAGVSPATLEKWRDDRDAVAKGPLRAIDEAVSHLQARYRSELRAANRAKHAGS